MSARPKFSAMKSIIYFTLLVCFSTCFAHDKFLIHSIPKCGTHFLQNVVTELTGKPTFTSEEPFSDKLEASEKFDQILRFNLPFDPDKAHELSHKRYKLICIIRDPRDALVSLIVYLRTYEGQGVKRDFFCVEPEFDSLTFDQQLDSVMTSEKKFGNFFSLYQSRIHWHRLPFAYGVKYENLVGSKGGGNDLLQLEEIVNIAEHINFPIKPKKAREIAAKIYHSSGTVIIDGKVFHHAKIGSWKRFLKPRHKEIFKKVFGNILIELGYEKDLNW